jgi:hypothetical protein
MIHAGMSYDWESAEWIREQLGVSLPVSLSQAAIIGYARLTSVGLRALGRGPLPPRAQGKFVFTFTDAHLFNTPITAVAGRRGFWPVPTRAREQIELPNHVELDLI